MGILEGRASNVWCNFFRFMRSLGFFHLMQRSGPRLWFVPHMHACAVKRAAPRCALARRGGDDLSKYLSKHT